MMRRQTGLSELVENIMFLIDRHEELPSYGKRKSPKSDKPSFSQKNRVYLQKNRVYLRKTWFFSRKTEFFRKTEFLCQINLVFLKN